MFLLPPSPFVVAFLATPPTLPNSDDSMIGEKTGKQKDAARRVEGWGGRGLRGAGGGLKAPGGLFAVQGTRSSRTKYKYSDWRRKSGFPIDFLPL